MQAFIVRAALVGLLVGSPSTNLFAQDDFRATRRLTLNLGLRYDATFPIKDSHNRLANYVPSQGVVQVGFGISEPYKTNWTNFSPRIGAAFSSAIFGALLAFVTGYFLDKLVYCPRHRRGRHRIWGTYFNSTLVKMSLSPMPVRSMALWRPSTQTGYTATSLAAMPL